MLIFQHICNVIQMAMILIIIVFAYLSFKCQFLLQVFNFGFIPENLSLELLLSLRNQLKHEACHP